MDKMEQARLSAKQRKARKALERKLKEREKQRDPRTRGSLAKAFANAKRRTK